MMELKFILIAVVLSALNHDAEGRLCIKFKEFSCFWDSACIPIDQMCDGKADCFGGEDEAQWFAGCGHCPNKFHCHRQPGDVKCIPESYLCDGEADCLNGEDETYEFTKCKKKCVADYALAKENGRPHCKSKCKKDKDCKGGKVCVCDHECGKTCINLEKTCPQLKKFPNLQSIRYVHRDHETLKVRDVKKFVYDVQAIHTCESGYVAVPTDTRWCHGRGTKNISDWTREIACALDCDEGNSSTAKFYQLSCGVDCVTDDDCDLGKKCACDGPCGRTCVNLGVECGDAPPVEHAIIEYTGEKFDRVAHYLCVEGTYKASGSGYLKCTGSGKWVGTPIECKEVYCGDPFRGLDKMHGRILNYSPPPYKFNTTLRFACEDDQRLLGASERTCLANGRWSGYDTVCDNIGTLDRCPHPGIPIDGELHGYRIDEDFQEEKNISFTCDEGYVMIGEKEQTCLFLKQWSGGGAPQCVHPRYSDVPNDVINKLYRSTSNIRPRIKYGKGGRTIYTNNPGGNEVYFVIDLSVSVSRTEISNTISFASSLVKRLSLNDTDDKVSYSIIVFASKAKLMLDIIERPRKTTAEILQILEDIKKNYKIIRNKIQTGTNMDEALLEVNHQMALSAEQNKNSNLPIKRHIFVLTDGRETAGGKPVDARRRLEQSFSDNLPEFYSITSAATEQDPEARKELQALASKEKNFIYVADFYKLHSYVDKVTDAREDYTKCGQAGEIGSVRKVVTLARTIGGEKAVERAWPWQALITTYDEDIRAAFHVVRGGGSLINTEWVLSAAHVFMKETGPRWWKGFIVSLGIIRRPQEYNSLQGSVKMFQPEMIYMHPEFHRFTLQNDIALIKLGGEYTVSDDGKKILTPNVFPGNVTLTPYIRPVCLPCSPDSCVSKILKKKDGKGQVLLTGNESENEACRIERDFLFGKNAEGNVAVVATGFGHNASREDDDESPLTATEYLHQAVLQILPRKECEEANDLINRIKAIPLFNHVFTEQMFCAVGTKDGNKGHIVDTCKGDSGGPIVREILDETTKESCFVQLGIVSYGYGCGLKTKILSKDYYYPAFYADVTSQLSWMRQIIKNHAKDEK